jgi:hypothetical protein
MEDHQQIINLKIYLIKQRIQVRLISGQNNGIGKE